MQRKSSLLLSLGCWLVMGMITQAASSNSTNGTSKVMFPLSADTQFSFYLSEVLSFSNGGGSNTGEVLRAASQIQPGSFESFYSEFKFLADTIHDQGATAEAGGFRILGRDAYFRSAEYYHAADFFLHLADFAKAISLLDVPGEKHTIRGPNFTIPIYYFLAKKPTSSCDDARIPTILVGTGYDGAQEELYHSYCRHVLERGWNCVTYEGPGQQTVRRQQNIGFTTDWWEVVTPVADYLATRPDVDMKRLALVGESFGAVLAPRAAAHDHRFAAVLLLDGVRSLLDAILEQLPSQMTVPFEAKNATAFNAVTNYILASGLAPSSLRWVVEQGMWSFHTTTPYDWMSQLRAYDLSEGVLANVTCPIFVGAGEDDTTVPGQARVVAQEIGSKGYYHLFKSELGAGEHCQLGAEGQLAMASLDWLAGVLSSKQHH